MKRICLSVLSLVLVCTLCAAKSEQIIVDDCLPAGNIIVKTIQSDTVFVKTDLRDTGRYWFYWAMRVKGAQGKKLVFVFDEKSVGARGPVISTDKGRTYHYQEGGKHGKTFEYSFGPREKEVWFYECIPYLPDDWNRFLKTLNKKYFNEGILCKSGKGNDVPMATFGNPGGKARYNVVITARHHCSESIANFVIEGILEKFCSKSETGQWLRENIELSVVPFVDYDGAINGDQGKARMPHDHNRDYSEFLYPETKAVSELFLSKQPVMILDMHCPWIAGKSAEYVYCPMANPEIVPDVAAEDRFSNIVEKNASGLPYSVSDNLPFGVSWNTSKNYSEGLSSKNWALLNIKSLKLFRTFEIPFANARGVEVNEESAREFGRSLGESIKEFLR